jgi:hypothetical protein
LKRGRSPWNFALRTFLESVEILDLADASYFASDLFNECYASAFPAPVDAFGYSHNSRSGTWHQFVAFYKWSETHVEPVGFCNWIRHGDVYLEGGLCVRPNFYRRLSKEHWLQCKQLGGISELMMTSAAVTLNDAEAWFAYCGDKRAYAATMRVGYRSTRHPFLIVKWFREVPRAREEELEQRVAALGPF